MKPVWAVKQLACLCALLCLLPAAAAADGGARVAQAGVRQGRETAAAGIAGQAFADNATMEGCTLTACAAVPDGAYGLSAVAQYTDADGDPCWLGFVQDGVLLPVGLSGDGTLQIAPDGMLRYVGDGTVTLSLAMKQAPEVVYDYTVSYTRVQEETNIAVRSEVRMPDG